MSNWSRMHLGLLVIRCRVSCDSIEWNWKGRERAGLMDRVGWAGKYEFVKASDVPVMGTTKLTPENIEMLLKTKSTGITTHKFAKIAAKIAPEVVAKHQAELALATSKVASCEKPESARR